MFGYLSQKICCTLIKNKILDEGKKAVYRYGIEVILLNLILFCGLIIVSILTKCMGHFVAFVIFFFPLRVFVGGYHAKHSETCLAASILGYIITVLVVKSVPDIYQSWTAIILTIIGLIIIITSNPIKNKNHLLADYQYKRNKLIAYVIILFDVMSFVFLSSMKSANASSELIFIFLAAVLFIIGKSEQMYEMKRERIL